MAEEPDLVRRTEEHAYIIGFRTRPVFQSSENPNVAWRYIRQEAPVLHRLDPEAKRQMWNDPSNTGLRIDEGGVSVDRTTLLARYQTHLAESGEAYPGQPETQALNYLADGINMGIGHLTQLNAQRAVGLLRSLRRS